MHAGKPRLYIPAFLKQEHSLPESDPVPDCRFHTRVQFACVGLTLVGLDTLVSTNVLDITFCMLFNFDIALLVNEWYFHLKCDQYLRLGFNYCPIAFQMGASQMGGWNTLKLTMQILYVGSGYRRAWILTLWWAIWKFRNNFIFKNCILDPYQNCWG